MEPLSATAITFGVILVFISWIYLIFTAFEEDYSWGLISIFVPFLSYLYGCFHWSKAKTPIWLAIMGWVLIAFAI